MRCIWDRSQAASAEGAPRMQEDKLLKGAMRHFHHCRIQGDKTWYEELWWRPFTLHLLLCLCPYKAVAAAACAQVSLRRLRWK